MPNENYTRIQSFGAKCIITQGFHVTAIAESLFGVILVRRTNSLVGSVIKVAVSLKPCDYVEETI